MRIQEENYRDEKKVPKVSVVMPIYNERRVELVRKAVDSVLTQSLKEIELLLINDGSDRFFWEKTVRQLPKEERIRIISLPHKGLAAALNSGIEVARGSYIARMDGDDLSRPSRLEKEVSFLEQNPDFDWVGCNAVLMDQSGIWGHRKMPEFPKAEDFYHYSPFIHPSVLFRREIFEKEKYNEVSLYERAEDYEFFMRLYSKGKKGCNLQEELFCYREGREDYRKRKYKYRLKECKVRAEGFERLGIRRGKGILYIGKPLFAGLVPAEVMRGYKEALEGNRRWQKRENGRKETGR